MFEILHVSLVSGIIKVLKNTTDEFVLSNLQGSLSKGRGVGVSTELDHKSGGLKVTEIRGDMQRRVKVGILPVEDLL